MYVVILRFSEFIQLSFFCRNFILCNLNVSVFETVEFNVYLAFWTIFFNVSDKPADFVN